VLRPEIHPRRQCRWFTFEGQKSPVRRRRPIPNEGHEANSGPAGAVCGHGERKDKRTGIAERLRTGGARNAAVMSKVEAITVSKGAGNSRLGWREPGGNEAESAPPGERLERQRQDDTADPQETGPAPHGTWACGTEKTRAARQYGWCRLEGNQAPKIRGVRFACPGADTGDAAEKKDSRRWLPANSLAGRDRVRGAPTRSTCGKEEKDNESGDTRQDGSVKRHARMVFRTEIGHRCGLCFGPGALSN